MSPRRAAEVGAAILATPALWRIALGQWRRTTPAGWWRRRPFLPVPPTEYLRFRLVTQYGDATHPVAVADVLNYLAWCKLQDR